MARRNGSQRTGPFKLPLFSASGMKKHAACLVRYGARYLLRLDEPSGEAAIKGTKCHEEMEDFSRFGKLPKSKQARAALKFCPPRGVAEVEVPIRFDTPQGCFLGYADLAYGWDEKKKRAKPIAPGELVVIHDWKFTGSLRNAQKPADLQKDFAANIYAWEAYLGGATHVKLRWVYVTFGNKPETKEVWVDMPLAAVRGYIFGGEFAERADEMRTLHYEARDAEDLEQFVLALPKSTGHCWAYKQKCPFYDLCKPDTTFKMGAANVTTPSNKDFVASLTADFPGGDSPKKAPPPPPRKSAPPPPPKKTDIHERFAKMTSEVAPTLREPGEPDRGFVNPSVGSPEKAPSSPEEAAEQQKIEPPKEAEPDDLESIDDPDVLKGIAAAEGVELKKGMRVKTIRDAIRLQRKISGRVELKESESAEDVPETPANITDALEEAAAEGWAAVEAAGELVEARTHEFMLCIDCQPDIRFMAVHELVKAGNARLNVQDYRQIQYTGAAELALAVRELFEEGAFAHVRFVSLYSNTPEGSALLETLRSLAVITIR